MKKKVLSAAVIAAMAMSLAACGNSAATNTTDEGNATSDAQATENTDAGSDTGAAATGETKGKIGIVVKTASNAHFTDIAYGAVLAGQDNGYEVIVNNTTTEADVDGQIQMCEDLISSGVQALILTANDGNGVSAAVEAAHDAGVKFVTVDTEITNDWGDSVSEYMPNYIGVNHEEMAYEMAKDIFEQMGGEGKLIILRGVDAASSSQERTAGFEKAAAEYDGIEILDSQSASYDQDTAANTMSDLLQAHPDVNVVLCCYDLMAKGACTALEENGIEVGGENGVVVAGIDGNYLALQSIDSDEIYASAYDWSILQGYYAVEQAIALINGEEVPENTAAPHTVITKENVNDGYLAHGEELDQWTMGDPVNPSQEMLDFIELGKSLEAEF